MPFPSFALLVQSRVESSFAEEKRLRSLLLSTAARDLPTLAPHSSLPSATRETSLKRPHQVACSPILRVRPERTRGAGWLRSRGAAIRSRVLHRCDRSAAHRTNPATRTKDGAKRRDKGLSDAAPGFHTDMARMCCSHSARHYIGPDSPTELAVNPSDGCAARLRHLRLCASIHLVPLEPDYHQVDNSGRCRCGPAITNNQRRFGTSVRYVDHRSAAWRQSVSPTVTRDRRETSQ